MNVALVSHSLFMPYLLLVFQSALRNTQNADVEKLPAHLQAIGQGFKGSRFRDRNALEPSNYNVGKLKSCPAQACVEFVLRPMTAIQTGASSVPQFTPLEVDPKEQV